jgi:signal transduction histidine kinase
LAYFLIAELGLGLYGQTNWVSVFWPAFGVSAGSLIALGPSARWQVATGVIFAILLAHLIAGDPPWLGPSFALSDAAEALVTAGLIHHYFGASFTLDRLRHVLGLLAAAIPGSLASFSVWIGLSKMFQDSTEPILTTWQHWFMGDIVGFVAVGPFVIGLFSAWRQPPMLRELGEGAVALVMLALMTVIIVLLPKGPWEILLPVAWLFPMLFWLAARCRPVFAAAGACMVSITVVWTTVFGIGHFGSAGLSIDGRNLQAQATILVVALGASVLAALFAEQRESEARLARSNDMLQRERDNKLMSLQAAVASISHEIKQPLGSIVLNAESAQAMLQDEPPDLEEARSALNDLIGDSKRAGEILDNVRELFGKGERRKNPIDVNKAVLAVLQIVREELDDHRVTTTSELATESPLVVGHGVQLEEVIANLVRNAIQAMDAVEPVRRTLKVRTRLNAKTVILEVEDSGPGIGPERLGSIFDAFVTSKADGTGLGLAISRMIIERHGGQLTASSDGKSGARFQVVLPIEPAG